MARKHRTGSSGHKIRGDAVYQEKNTQYNDGEHERYRHTDNPKHQISGCST